MDRLRSDAVIRITKNYSRVVRGITGVLDLLFDSCPQNKSRRSTYYARCYGLALTYYSTTDEPRFDLFCPHFGTYDEKNANFCKNLFDMTIHLGIIPRAGRYGLLSTSGVFRSQGLRFFESLCQRRNDFHSRSGHGGSKCRIASVSRRFPAMSLPIYVRDGIRERRHGNDLELLTG